MTCRFVPLEPTATTFERPPSLLRSRGRRTCSRRCRPGAHRCEPLADACSNCCPPPSCSCRTPPRPPARRRVRARGRRRRACRATTEKAPPLLVVCRLMSVVERLATASSCDDCSRRQVPALPAARPVICRLPMSTSPRRRPRGASAIRRCNSLTAPTVVTDPAPKRDAVRKRCAEPEPSASASMRCCARPSRLQSIRRWPR